MFGITLFEIQFRTELYKLNLLNPKTTTVTYLPKNVGKDLFYCHSSKFMAEQKIKEGERTVQRSAKRTAQSPREGVG